MNKIVAEQRDQICELSGKMLTAYEALEARCRVLDDALKIASKIRSKDDANRIAELEAALRRLKGETFCSRDWYAAFGACLELVRDGVTASETSVKP